MINRLCNRIDNSKLATWSIWFGICLGFMAMVAWGMNNTHAFM